MEKLGFALDNGSSPADKKQINPQENLSIQRCIQSLVHACQCRNANCRLSSCQKMKREVMHAKYCKRRKTNGDCPICKQLIALCRYHAKGCQETKCLVPFCSNIKHKIKQQQLQQRLQQARLLTNMYCVAEFIETAETEVIPIKWMNERETKCFWPYYKSTDRVKKAVLSIEIPNPNTWTEYAVRVLHKYNTYQEARSHLSKAEYTSHLDSEENNDNEHRNKRKRIHNRIHSLSDESLASNKPKQNKNKSRLRSPPKIIRSPDKCTLARENSVSQREQLSRVRNIRENENVVPTTSINGTVGHRKENSVSRVRNDKDYENFTNSVVPTTSINGTKNSVSRVRSDTENEDFTISNIPTPSRNSESLELLILEKLRKLDYIQNNIIIPDLTEILSLLRPQRLEVFQETNVPTLPIDNETQLDEFEQYLSITENYKNMILKFNRVGGHTAAGITRKIMKNLITSKFAMNFNWGGKRALKRPFKELKSKNLILDSVRKAIPSVSTHLIEIVIKDWLKQAKTRVTLRKVNVPVTGRLSIIRHK
ncbi:uncharacterized protein [Temnothorax nylanderi]